jgi:hypothetical protein
MILGAPWNADWRDRQPVTPDYQGYGGTVAFLNLESPTGWNPHTGLVVANGYIGGYDPVQLQLETQGELRAGSTIGWPTSGQAGPNPDVSFLVLAHESGIDVGGQLSQSMGPRMVFASPPSYGSQTTPLAAVGL